MRERVIALIETETERRLRKAWLDVWNVPHAHVPVRNRSNRGASCWKYLVFSLVSQPFRPRFSFFREKKLPANDP